MAHTHEEARQQILGDLGIAVEQISLAVECLGEAYEELSVDAQDRLESELFRPVQKALGRAKRTREGFSQRFNIPGEEPEPISAAFSVRGAKALVEAAASSAVDADLTIADLQDTMYPIESGDAQLRADLAEVRELLDGLTAASREFLRTLGR